METKRRESKREGEIEGKKTHTTCTKGGQAQQSVANSHVIFVMLTVPSSYPLSEGDKPKAERENVFTLTHTFRRAPFCVFFPPSRPFSEQYLIVANNSSVNSPVSIQGSHEQGLKPLLAALISLFSFLCNYFTFESIIGVNHEVKRRAPCGQAFFQKKHKYSKRSAA